MKEKTKKHPKNDIIQKNNKRCPIGKIRQAPVCYRHRFRIIMLSIRYTTENETIRSKCDNEM